VTSGGAVYVIPPQYPENQCPSAYRVEGVSRCLNCETLNLIISSFINQSSHSHSRYKHHTIIGRERPGTRFRIQSHQVNNPSYQRPLAQLVIASWTCYSLASHPPLINQYEFLWPLENQVAGRERQAPSRSHYQARPVEFDRYT
jgi:hypothetical protein